MSLPNSDDESVLRALSEIAKSRHHRFRVAADAVPGALRGHLRLLDEQSACTAEDLRAALGTFDSAEGGPRFVRFSHYFSTRHPCDIIAACLECEAETLRACRDALNAGSTPGELRAMIHAHIQQISASQRLLQRLRDDLAPPASIACEPLGEAVPA
jgi:hypothetical protein